MSTPGGVETAETLSSTVRIHVVGAGPVGFLVAALLQSTDRFAVRLYSERAVERSAETHA